MSPPARSRRRSRRVPAALAGVLTCAGLAAGAIPALAAPTAGPQGSVDGAYADKGSLELVLGAQDENGKAIDLQLESVTEVTATVEGQTRVLEAQARPAAEAADRAAVLVLDTSGSMREQGRLPAAKAAAATFLQAVPDDVRVGLVTFGDPARSLLEPTTDHGRVGSTIRSLEATGNTAMFEAVVLATRMLRPAANRSILLLTDGKDDDKGKSVEAPAAQKALRDLGVNLTAVTVNDDGLGDVQKLTKPTQIIRTEDGSQLESRLNQAFQNEGDALEKQVAVTAALPPEWRYKPGDVQVEASTADGTQVTFTAPYISGEKPPAAPTAQAAPQLATPDPRLTAVNTPVVIVAIVALFGALCVLVATSTGALARGQDEESEVVRRISVYTLVGREPRRQAVSEQTTALGNSAVARSAVELADRLTRGRGLDRSLDGRLDAAGLPLRTAEWTVIHIGVAVGTTLLFLLIGAGTIIAGVIGLVLGLAAPWMFLTVRQSRRESAFLAQLPDTLQLLAGSLQAGYSLPQAMDTVVREAKPPIGTEFNRALVEARLGVPPEDALEGIANRTRSRDFSWIVMAIRIQRDIGGNLAELLATVAETLRERERLRRQVSALSAEGRLSGIILAALPLIFTIYLLLVQPDYLRPMYTTQMGILLLSLGGILLVVGGIWMSRVVKVRV